MAQVEPSKLSNLVRPGQTLRIDLDRHDGINWIDGKPYTSPQEFEAAIREEIKGEKEYLETLHDDYQKDLAD